MKTNIFKSFFAVAVSICMLFSAGAMVVAAYEGEDTEIYEDEDIITIDFQNYSEGAKEIEGMTISTKTDKSESGSIQVVEYGKNKDKVLKYTKTTGATNIAHYTDLAPNIGIKGGREFVLQMNVMFEKPVPNTTLIEGRKVDASDKAQFMTFLSANGTGFTVPSNDKVIQKIVLYQWYNVALVIDDAARTYDVYIDGEIKADDVAYSKTEEEFPTANKYSCIRGINLTGQAMQITAYVDDIYLFYGNTLKELPKEEPAPEEEEEEEEEEKADTLFPAVDPKPSTSDKSETFNEKTTDRIYLAVIGAFGVGAVVFCTVIKYKQKKHY